MSDDPDTATSLAFASVPVFAPIAAPILRSVDPVKVARFLIERERYEIEIWAKKVEVPTLKPLPYSASIDRTLLKSLFYMGKFDNIAPDAATAKELTDDHIKTYFHSLVSRSNTTVFDPTIIEAALSGFSMQTEILDAEARITTYFADFFERLESVGCGSFTEDNPKKAVRLLCSRLHPEALKKEMRKRIDYDQSLEKSVKVFIKVLTQEAINCQAYSGAKSTELSRHPRKNPTPGSGKDGGKQVPVSPTNLKNPICPYPPHKERGLRHFLKDCRDCTKEQKDKLFEEMRAQKKDTVKRTIDIAQGSRSSDVAQGNLSSVIFSATFANKIRTTVCADIGADATLMDAKMLAKMKKAGVDVQIEKLDPIRTFGMAAVV